MLHVGSYTPAGGGDGVGITVLEHDLRGGTLRTVGTAASLCPSYLAWHPNGRFLYAVEELGVGGVEAFGVGADGGLVRLGRTPTGGVEPCHLTVDPRGRHLVVANYGSGSVTVHPIRSDGRLAAASALLPAPGPGSRVHHLRQAGAHAHEVLFDPTGTFLVVTDLGRDELRSYLLDDAGRLELAAVSAMAPGSGPRHLAWAEDGLAFLACELNSSVTLLRLDPATGEFSVLNRVAATASPVSALNLPSEIVLNELGSLLYLANRGADRLSTFAVLATGYHAIADVSCGGRWPRHIHLAGDHLYVANQHSHEVVVFRIDPVTGLPAHTGLSAPVFSPACITVRPPHGTGAA